ncbi:hypothetical protein BV898_19237 [Hypsibius exemplaris]|uniref:Reverse transcriptase domain-containing protein n=1 Tax=Hypsibius exemplaris TaxID=2072580 RepID=A0A9X6RNR3_HYPEX|nr:hypothetical protein BV898_19237 [Hypsibius exemplaris]
MMCQGVPFAVCPLLYGGTLTALNKKDGGIRPIACGNTLRRLVGKIVSRRVMAAMGELVRPQQLGYGTPGGAEAVVHATRAFLEEKEETLVVLKLDFKNAFNTVHRNKLLAAARNHLPEYYALVDQMYRHRTELFFGEHVLPSESGVQQGDPLGPLLFCLVTRGLSGAMRARLNAWYLDDFTLGDTVDVVLEDLQSVMRMGSDIGLEFNLAKCEAFVFAEDVADCQEARAAIHQFAPTISFPGPEELSLLGAPLLLEGISTAMDIKTATLRLLASRLGMLPAHQALFILRNCLSTPKVLYMLRCSLAWFRPDKLEAFDEVLRSSVEGITNTAMTPMVWRQATLPVSRGGLGIRKTSELAYPAYLASVHASKDFIAIIAPKADLDEILVAPTHDWCSLTGADAPVAPKRQKDWDTPIAEKGVRSMWEVTSVRDTARLRAVACKESGAWLNALPIPSLGNLLNDNSLRVSVALRFGALVCQPHVCQCGARVNADGQHGLSCQKSAGRPCRHSSMNDIVKRALVTAGVQSILEPTGLDQADGKRPDGLTLAPWKRGKALAWDVTCVDTMADSYIGGSLITAGHASTKAEEKKNTRYQNIMDRVLFGPLAFETFGPWGPETKTLIGEIAEKMKEQTGAKRSLEYLRQRISIEIQRGNATCVFGTHPFSRGLDEVFSILKVKH